MRTEKKLQAVDSWCAWRTLQTWLYLNTMILRHIRASLTVMRHETVVIELKKGKEMNRAARNLINYLFIIGLAGYLLYQNQHLLFSGEDFKPGEYFQEHKTTKHFTFYYNSDARYISGYSFFTNTLVDHIQNEYFAPDFSGNIDYYVLKDAIEYKNFLARQLGVKESGGWGVYLPERNALVTYEAAGLGTFGHITMYPIIGNRLADGPHWIKQGIPTLFEKIYGYLEGENLILSYGFHNPWRLEKLGDLTKLNLEEIIKSDSTRAGSASKSRLVVTFIHQNGVFPVFIQSLLSNNKGEYDTFIEYAFKRQMPALEQMWDKYLADIEGNLDEILSTPSSQMFESKDEYEEVAGKFKGL